MSPVVPHEFLMNLDLLNMHDSAAALRAVLDGNKAVLGQTEAVADPNNITKEDLKLIGINADFLQRGQYRHQPGFYRGDPLTKVTYPVFSDFTPNRTVAGFLVMPLIWRLNLQKVLPKGVTGVVAVLENKFNQSFTYRIDGPNVTYLGLQDFHDSTYDDMFTFENVEDTIKANHGPESQTYHSVELDIDFSRYNLYIYPSQTLKDDYITNEPAIYAAIVASIFAFTLAVLVAFDFLVTQRQQVIMQKAVESSALVSTLYPKQVRDQLFEKDKSEKPKKWRASTVDESVQKESKAIAQRYPASSVLLMDLAGFTKWSATREPEAVFELLENLYSRFDRIAEKRGIYKIETVSLQLWALN